MNMARATNNATHIYITGAITSKDGTTIAYRQLGNGPGIILVHGALTSSLRLMKLGHALSDTFTVYIPDRRGRGLSGKFGDNYSMQREIEDLDALLDNTGTHNVFGHSAGALISLRAALALPAIRKAAFYEPPLDIDSLTHGSPSFVVRANQEIAEGKMADAMVTYLKGFIKDVEPRTGKLGVLPRFILVRLVARFLQNDAMNVKRDDVPFRELLPTFRFDYQLVAESEGTLKDYKAMTADILLLNGSKSPPYLKHAVDALSQVIPNVRRVEFQGLGHSAPVESDKLERVAHELRRFFL